MTQLQSPPKDFDIAVEYTKTPGYVPFPTRDPELASLRIARRSLVVRKQAEGIQIGGAILRETMDDPESAYYARRLVAATFIKTAWHNTAEHATDVGRRRAKLYDFTRFTPDTRPDTAGVTEHALTFMQDVIQPAADQIVLVTERRLTRNMDTRKRNLGRRLGDGALILAAANVGNIAADNPHLSDVAVQGMVKSESLGIYVYARELGNELEGTVTLAHLTDVDSPLYVHTRRHAPTPVVDAYTNAIAEFAKS